MGRVGLVGLVGIALIALAMLAIHVSAGVNRYGVYRNTEGRLVTGHDPAVFARFPHISDRIVRIE